MATTIENGIQSMSIQKTSSSSCLPTLSKRGQRHGKNVTAFWDTFDKIIGNAFCHETNPYGIVNMAISNNYLLEPELLAYFGANLQMQPTDLTYGTSLFGSHRLFSTLCSLFNSKTFNPCLKVEPQHLITGPGCGPLLDQMAEHLAEPGDGMLIAAPYYNGYDADFACRCEVQCIPVFSKTDDGTGANNFEGKSALRGFEEAKEEWQKNNPNNTIRALIVCNPHNPVGRCYDREALIEYGRFAEKHNLHLIFDEIFAMSTYSSTLEKGKLEPFHSALSIDWQKEANCHPARTHVIWSASKDFGINGLRVGTLISQANPALLRAMKATAKLYMVSSPADALFCALIDNQEVYNDFIRTNQARMAQAYDIVVRWCTFHKIKHVSCSAGHFILIDLTRFLPEEVDGQPLQDPAAREGALWAHFLQNAVCLTPGSNYHHPQLGMFRMTFTLRKPALLEGLLRIEKALGLPTWHGRDECMKEEEEQMQTIKIKELKDRSISTITNPIDGSTQTFTTSTDSLPSPLPKMRGSASREQLSLSQDEAQAQRQEYVDAVQKVLKEGGGSEALLSCGMGMACSACV